MKNNIWNLLVLLKRISILFVIYQISRLFFFWTNRAHFQEINFSHLLQLMKGGVRFDLTALIYLNGLFILISLLPFPFRSSRLYQNILFWVYIIPNAIGFALNLMDTVYFDYVLKRSTVEVFMFAKEGNIGTLFIQFLKDFWWGFVLWALFVWITTLLYKSIKVKPLKNYKPRQYYPFAIIVLLVGLYFSVIGIRGGFARDTRPININNAGAYTEKPLEMAIVLNTPFTILRTLTKHAFKPVHFYDDKEIEQIYTPIKHLESKLEFDNKNVFIIIVESLAREYTGLLNKDIENYKGYTPFLDSLMLESHTYTNAYANGRKSIDAMPSILASIPSLVQPYVLSPYASNKLLGLGEILKSKGYTTAFFHGAPNGSMGFDAFVNLAGYDRYIGATEYDNKADFDGNWGIWDLPFLQFTAQELNKLPQPFLGTIFTLSSHHPFKIPKEFEGEFRKGKLPIHEPIQYTDYALRQFFKTASRMPWYNNTIFVITADHCNQTYLPEYNSVLGAHAVPIIFFEPGNTDNKKLDDRLTQQIDILPKLLEKMHYSGDFVSFGNMSNDEKPNFAINYIGGTWQFSEGDYLLQYRNQQSIALFNYKKDRDLKQSLLDTNKAVVMKMEKRLKAFIQQYKNRMIDNKLHIDK